MTVDLSDTTTLNEVIERINNTSDLNVTASIEGDHLKISNVQTIADATGYFTATDLGIDGSGGVGDEIVGTDINTVGVNSALADLNDGNGVLIRDGVNDFALSLWRTGSLWRGEWTSARDSSRSTLRALVEGQCL